jgi:hypothetical protein
MPYWRDSRPVSLQEADVGQAIDTASGTPSPNSARRDAFALLAAPGRVYNMIHMANRPSSEDVNVPVVNLAISLLRFELQLQ